MSNLLDRVLPLRSHSDRKGGTGTVVTLTPLGRQKAEKYDQPGVKFSVLNHLNDAGPSTVTEISNATQVNPMKVKAVLKALMVEGYVRKAATEE